MKQYLVPAHQQTPVCESVLLAESTPRKYEKAEGAGEAPEDKYSSEIWAKIRKMKKKKKRKKEK